MALFGAALAALALLAMPLVTLRPNRLVEGEPLSAFAASGAYAALPVTLAAIAAIAAFLPRPRRGAILAVIGTALLVSVLWTVGFAAETMRAGAGPLERVSVASGAWLALAGGAAVTFTGFKGSAGQRWLHAVLVTALVAGAVGAAAFGGLTDTSLATEYEVQSRIFWRRFRGHLSLAGASLLSAAVLGVPLGTLAARDRRVRRIALTLTGVVQTVPSLALLGLLIAPIAALTAAYPLLRQLGLRAIGFAPAFAALTLYGLLPIVRNTYLGLQGADPAVVDAGRGMGMTSWQLLVRVRFPLALPLVLEGVRIGAVLLVGIATVTALAGARTLGTLVFDGLGQGAPDLTLLGALPIIGLAVTADYALRGLARLVAPGGAAE